jgi:hypothetical protein
MSKDSRKKTDDSRRDERRGLFEYLRDGLYHVVFTEGDFALQLVGDFVGGTNRAREQKHLERQLNRKERLTHGKAAEKFRKPQIKPLTYEERQVYLEILARKPGEDQVKYWKRKKKLLNVYDKQELVKQELENRRLIELRRQQQSQARNERREAREQQNQKEKEERIARTQRTFEGLRKDMKRKKTLKKNSKSKARLK